MYATFTFCWFIFNCKQDCVAVISGVGARNFYRRLGYGLQGHNQNEGHEGHGFMLKKLKKPVARLHVCIVSVFAVLVLLVALRLSAAI